MNTLNDDHSALIAIKIKSPFSNDTVNELAKTYNMTSLGTIGELPDYFMFTIQKHKFHKRMLEFENDNNIHWVEEQFAREKFSKRLIPVADITATNSKLNLSFDIYSLANSEERYTYLSKMLNISDPGFPKQSYLFNANEKGYDLNLTGVWLQNITGKGINVALLDDGLDYEHEDLKDNFYAEGSYDFNGRNKLPKPRLYDDFHGTRCAGQIAAVRNNYCGIGIAYDAHVSGLRILSGPLSHADLAASFNYDYQNNHIYSCSWGPPDDGRTMKGPPTILRDAIVNGVTRGRDGKGSIFVFAAGNGGAHFDNCNFDGYTNSIYTITVGSVDQQNGHPMYSELCSATLVVTYGGGSRNGLYTTTFVTNSPNQCTNDHKGTSAAAPEAAGVIALVLSIRPQLTWRDIQRLLVETSVPVSTNDDDWKPVAKNRTFNHKYGYGLIDGYSMVEAAKKHKLVSQQVSITVSEIENQRVDIPDTGEVVTKIFTVNDNMIANAKFARLEHITVTFNLAHQRRGDILINLESPNGVVSELITARAYDESRDGFPKWTAMSVKHWDEELKGDWRLKIKDVNQNGKTGQWNSGTITFWGEEKSIEEKPKFDLNLDSISDAIITNQTVSSSYATGDDYTGETWIAAIGMSFCIFFFLLWRIKTLKNFFDGYKHADADVEEIEERERMLTV